MMARSHEVQLVYEDNIHEGYSGCVLGHFREAI